MSREQLLTSTFVELADTLVDDFDVIDFLQNLVGRSREILGVTVCGLVLADPRGKLKLVTSTSHQASVLRLFDLASTEGPGADCYRSGQPVVNVSADVSSQRWPGFVQEARAAGYHAVHVLPMRLRSEVIGTLDVFANEEMALSDDDVAVAKALAAVATISLLQERTDRQKELLATQLRAALNLRVMVEQAKGVVAERADVGVDEAFDLMLTHGRQGGLSLGQVAARILDGSLDLSPTR